MDQEIKTPLTGLFRDNPETPEGKYLVKRRDGTVMEKPNFVLVATDPNAADTLRFYALLNLLPPELRDELVNDIKRRIDHWLRNGHGLNQQYVKSVVAHAVKWCAYRKKHGDSDPLMGKHRKDDPATIAEMRQGHSA